MGKTVNDQIKVKHFQGLWTLISMQFKEKMSFSFKADKKGALTKLLLYAILMIGIGAGIGVVFYLLGKSSILGRDGVPLNIFNFFFIIMFVVNIISCLNGLTNSLYFSEDNQTLLTYPVKPNTVFFSKIIVYYLFELIKDFGMLVPYFIAYGIVYDFQIIYYPWVIFCFTIIAFIPVAISGILSIPLMYIKMLLKKYNTVQTIVMLAGVIGVTGLAIWLISLIPERLEIAKQWLTVYWPAVDKFTSVLQNICAPIAYLSTLVIGISYKQEAILLRSAKVFGPLTAPILGIVLGAILVAILFTYFVCKPLFFTMASKPFEYAKKVISHDYKILESEAQNSFTGDYFVVENLPDLKNKNAVSELNSELKKLLKKVKKEEKLFLNKKIDIKRVLRFLNKYSKTYKFSYLREENRFNKELLNCYSIILRNDVPSLVYVEDFKLHVHLYDPMYLPKQNSVKGTTVSSLFKELLIDLRTPGVFISNYVMVVLPPVALLLLNTIFNACGLKQPVGYFLAIMFDTILVSLMMLTTNISMASIYSREGKTSYMLKAMPVDFIRTLGTKLIVRAA
ncbi:MAG: hypothetical protein MJ248_07215, partial [Bacilli bacterium]|nr:hypothetical protein [Bacilli bacterium]